MIMLIDLGRRYWHLFAESEPYTPTVKLKSGIRRHNPSDISVVLFPAPARTMTFVNVTEK